MVSQVVNTPSRPISEGFVDRSGSLGEQAQVTLEDLWRRVVAGFVTVPVVITGTNDLVLTALRHKEGHQALDDYMVFVGVAENTSTGAVRARLPDAGDYIKVYKDHGANQAGVGDVVQNLLYFWVYNSALDGGAGGFVLK